ncbi:MAG: DUF4388 domain-containing protein [Kiritimatiellae bacterium]|nr:DUF4388 domain-containing protein [Kiritimatiellia bacterium]
MRLPTCHAASPPAAARWAHRLATVGLAVLFGLAPASGQPPDDGAEPPAPAQDSTLGYLRVIAPDVEVSVPDRNLEAQAFAKYPLIGEDRNHYFIAGPTRDVSAFPKKDKRGRSNAWVGEARIVFFAKRTSCVGAKLSLDKGAELPLLAEQDDEWWVMVSGEEGHHAQLAIPKTTAGLSFHKTSLLDEYRQRQEAARLAAEREKRRKAAQAAARRREEAQNAGDGPDAGNTGTSTSAGPSSGGTGANTGKIKKVSPSFVIDMSSLTNRVQPSEAKPKKPFFDSLREHLPEGLLDNASSPVVLIAAGSFVLLIVIIVVVAVVASRRRRNAEDDERPRKGPITRGPIPIATGPPLPAPPPPTVTEEEVHQEMMEKVASGEMIGSLETVMPVDLVQFLNLSKQSGQLIIGEETNPFAAVIFEEGEVISARYEGQKGDGAVIAILHEREGVFVFKKGPDDPEAIDRNVQRKTGTLLMEAVQQMDEAPRPSTRRRKKKQQQKRRLSLRGPGGLLGGKKE